MTRRYLALLGGIITVIVTGGTLWFAVPYLPAVALFLVAMFVVSVLLLVTWLALHVVNHSTRVLHTTDQAIYIQQLGRIQVYQHIPYQGAPHQTVVTQVPQQLALPSPSMLPSAPTFQSIRHLIQPGRLILGYSSGGAIYGDVSDLLSMGIVGKPGTGKSSALLYYLAMLLLVQADVYVFDPHGSLNELAGCFNYADDLGEIAGVVPALHHELDERGTLYKRTRQGRKPLLVLIDELPVIARYEQRSKPRVSTLAMVERIVLEGRKWGCYVILSGQSLPADVLPTLTRDNLSYLVFKIRKIKGLKLMDNTQLVHTDTQDSNLIDMWLHGRSAHTQRAYRQDIQRLQVFIGKPIQETTLPDLQAFSDTLVDLKDSSKTRVLNAVKSFFSFMHDTGLLPVNVGAALRPPKLKNELAQRILTEEQAVCMIALETNPRNHALLRLMYHCGLRVSEVVALTWNDLQPRNEGGQVTIFGKGSKTRVVLVGADMWKELLNLDGRYIGRERYIFQSRKGKAGTQPLDASQVNRIVTDAATRAGIQGDVSPHWLRHAHASHSLDRGAPINLVRETLGHASIATTGKYTHARPNASSSQFLPL